MCLTDWPILRLIFLLSKGAESDVSPVLFYAVILGLEEVLKSEDLGSNPAETPSSCGTLTSQIGTIDAYGSLQQGCSGRLRGDKLWQTLL